MSENFTSEEYETLASSNVTKNAQEAQVYATLALVAAIRESVFIIEELLTIEEDEEDEEDEDDEDE